MSSFPQEILDEIVRHVDTDAEPESLFQPFPSHLNLALAARCFVHASYSRIYEKVKFRHEGQTSFGLPRTTPTYRKRANFEAHPRLIQYIRHVEVSAAFAFPRRKHNGELYQSLASLSECMVNVTKVQLHSSRVVDWDDVSPGCQDAIRHLASTNPVTELIVSNVMNIPLISTLSLSSLRNITVLLGGSVSSGSLNLQGQELRLESYTHRSSGATSLGTLFSPQLPAFYAGLVTLDLSLTSIEMHKDAWSTVLSDDCRPVSLKTLRIVYGKSSYRGSADHFVHLACQDMINTGKSLPTFPHLTSVSLSFLAGERTSEQRSTTPLPLPLPCSLGQLFYRNSLPSLETLQVLMRWHPTVGPSISSQFLNEQPMLDSQDGQWELLDQVLSDDTKFPRIRAIRLGTQYRLNDPALYGDTGGELMEEARILLKTQMLAALPRTARGVPELVIKVSEGPW